MKPPTWAMILLYVTRAAFGIAGGTALVMAVFVVAKFIGYPIQNQALGEAAFDVWFLATAVWCAIAIFARFFDWRRGL